MLCSMLDQILVLLMLVVAVVNDDDLQIVLQKEAP